MGMTLKELLTKGEGTLTAGEAKTLASQCRMDVETLYTLLEERGIKILDDEADGDTSLDVEGIMAEVESAEANSDELGLGDENEDDPAEENPADLKAAMDELLDDPVKNYLKQIGQIPPSASTPVPRLPTSFRPTARSTARLSTSKRTAPASRSRRMRTAGAIPRIWTRTATPSPARTTRKRLPKRRPWRLLRTAL